MHTVSFLIFLWMWVEAFRSARLLATGVGGGEYYKIYII